MGTPFRSVFLSIERPLQAQGAAQNAAPAVAAVPAGAKAEVAETPMEALASICTILAIGMFVFGFIFQNFEIPSGSMLNTLLIGDHVVVDRITLAPATKWAPWVHYRAVRRGDIIVFMKPNPETPDLILVKRTIGVPCI
jgi:signal peptidase I